jgi:hypothetical protein
MSAEMEVSASGWSLVQRSPTECGVSQVCDRESSKNEEAYAPYGLSSHRKKNSNFKICAFVIKLTYYIFIT